MFGSRLTAGGQTPEMVAKCSLVIATNSTSISYAVAFAKPLILMTSDQIQNGRDQYKASLIANIAKETGAKIFNIDREYTEQELRDALVIDHAKRESYKRKYLTSRTDGKPNYRVLLDEVINAID
jgi:phage-related protein